MITRFLAVLFAIVVAYAAAVILGPNLPPIKMKTEASRPLTLPEILSKYLVHSSDESLHLLTSPRPAEWDSVYGPYFVYDLANVVPTADGNYASTGGSSVESLYETFLLSLKAGDDVALAKLQREYLAARNAALSSSFRAQTRAKQRAAQQKALDALLAYADNVETGPAPKALAKAIRDYYGSTMPKVRLPDGEERNYRSIIVTPALDYLRTGATTVPAVDILVPATETTNALVGSVAVRAQQLRIAEVTLQRPWLDMAILAHTQGPWLTDDPKLFGRTGSFPRIPIRLALVERPALDAATAGVVTGTGGAASAVIGPFTYAASEVHATGNLLALRPIASQWVVIAVITKEL